MHISQISDNYIKHPSEVLKVGETVKVKVLGVDIDKKKISLTMKTTERPNGIAVQNQKTDMERKQGRQNADRRKNMEKSGYENAKPKTKKEQEEELLALLYKKFGR